MRRSLSVLIVVVAAIAMQASTATAATTITINGQFREITTRVNTGPRCFNGAVGIGQLQGYGKACEQFTYQSFDGYNADGCPMFTGTDTFTLNDAQRSSFTELEHETACFTAPNAPGQKRSFGNPGIITGTWTFVPGTGTGVFANVCAGSGSVSLHFAGAAGIADYTGELTRC